MNIDIAFVWLDGESRCISTEAFIFLTVETLEPSFVEPDLQLAGTPIAYSLIPDIKLPHISFQQIDPASKSPVHPTRTPIVLVDKRSILASHVHYTTWSLACTRMLHLLAPWWYRNPPNCVRQAPVKVFL